jgi:Histidine kinase
MRIAGELHDGVLQQITSLTLGLGTAMIKLPPDSDARARIKQSQDELMQMGAEIRNLAHELHPRRCGKRVCRRLCLPIAESSASYAALPFPAMRMRPLRNYRPGRRCVFTGSRRKRWAMWRNIPKPSRRKFG